MYLCNTEHLFSICALFWTLNGGHLMQIQSFKNLLCVGYYALNGIFEADQLIYFLVYAATAIRRLFLKGVSTP